MRSLSLSILLITFLFAYNSSFSQEYTYQPSGEVLTESYEALASEDTVKSLALLNSIPVYDTNYQTALADRIYLNNRLKQSDVSLQLLEEAMANPGDSEHRYYILKAVAHRNLEQYDQSIQAAKEGIKKFPYSNSLYFNIAAAFEDQEMLDSAIVYYQKSIYHNFGSASGHLRLGIIYAQNGYLTEGALALTMAILADNSSSVIGSRIGYLENVLKNEHTLSDNPVKLPGALDLDEIDILLENQIALSKKYKVKSDFDNLNITKSLNLIFEKLPTDLDTNTFFYKNYISFYSGIPKNNLLDGQIGYMLYGWAKSADYKENSSQINAVLKNESEIKKFLDYAAPAFEKIGSRAGINDGKKPADKEYYFSKGNIGSIGHYTDKPVGDWTYFHPNQVISSIGTYNQNGERNGKWIWFNEKGDTTYAITFENNKQVGLYKNYHVNGKISLAYTKNNEELAEGEAIDYFLNGALYSKTPYQNGIKEGTQYYYNMIGGVRTEVQWKEGEAEGMAIGYWPDNSVKYKEPYKANQLNGEGIYYHQGSKQISAEGNFVDGEKEGVWTWYHPNGKIKEKGSHKKGAPIGHWEEYDIEGTLITAYDYDENTKRNGEAISYFNGKTVRKETYSKGEYVGYICYDLEGNVLSEVERKKGKLPVNLYYPNGNLKVNGLLIDGAKEGVWKFYYENGAKESVEYYHQGIIAGTDTAFYATGGLSNTMKYNRDGESHGPSINYYKSGKIAETTWYENDKITGWNVEYNILGDTTHAGYYLNGKAQGRTTNYYLNGKPQSQFEYDHSFLSHFYSYDTNGILVYDVDLTLGEKTIELPYKNGNIQRVASYTNGKAHGLFRWNFYDGSPEVQGEIFFDQRHGEWKWTRENGKTQTIGVYAYGNQVGEWKQYDILGRLEKIENYNAAGNAHNLWTYYHPNGKVSITRNYLDGNSDGEAKYFDDQGELQFVEYKRNGVIIGYAYNNTDGTLKAMIPIEKETVSFKTYFANGKLSAEKGYKNGSLHGVYKKYRTDGSVIFSSSLVDGMYQGEYLSYYDNGKPFEELNYLDDELHGSAKYYHKNGQVYLAGNYKAGEKHGEFKFYNENGKLTQTVLYNTGTIIKAW